MTTEALPAGRAPHPVSFDVEYPEHVSRLTTFFRVFLAIPQLIIIYLLQTVLQLLTVFAWFAILFTGRYPKDIFNFNASLMRWSVNVVAYVALLRDEYPPFSGTAGEYPLTLGMDPAERQSRWRLFIRIFAVIPNQIVFSFVQLGWLVTTIIAWFAILLTGRYPRGLFGFGVGVMRWYCRQMSYLLLFRDEYPPYRLRAEARPGNEAVSAVIGVPIFAAYIALYIFSLAGVFGAESDTVVVQSALTSPLLAQEAPSGEANGIRVTILAYNDDAPRPVDVEDLPGYRFVAFGLAAEKDGFFPTFFSPFFMRLHDCSGFGYSPEAVSGGFEFRWYWRGGEDEGVAVFQIPLRSRPCDLVYHAGLGKIEFAFFGGP